RAPRWRHRAQPSSRGVPPLLLAPLLVARRARAPASPQARRAPARDEPDRRHRRHPRPKEGTEGLRPRDAPRPRPLHEAPPHLRLRTRLGRPRRPREAADDVAALGAADLVPSLPERARVREARGSVPQEDGARARDARRAALVDPATRPRR